MARLGLGLFIGLAAISLLAACEHARAPSTSSPLRAASAGLPPASAPGVPSAPSAAPSASATALPPAEVPARFRGTYAVAHGESGKPSTVQLFEVGEGGARAPRPVVMPATEVESLAFSVDGTTLVVTHRGGHDGHGTQELLAVPLDGGKQRTLTTCGYQCEVLGVGVDGEVWYVHMDTSTLLGDLRHVPIGGGPAVKWPHGFAACALGGFVTPDGRSLVLAVDNALGWPECIDSGKQGFYVLSIGQLAKRDALPPRTTCFPSGQKATNINLRISSPEFDPPDRFAFAGGDGWADGGDGFWSCTLAGADPVRRDRLGPHLSSSAIGGVDWITVETLSGPPPGYAEATPTPILGPFRELRAFAFHARPPG